MKKCSKCLNIKEHKEFYKGSVYRDGFHCWCKDCVKICKKIYCGSNKEKEKLRKRKWYLENAEKERMERKVWNQTHKPLKAYYAAKRRALILRATPKWINKDEIEFIEMKYRLANYLTETTKEKWEVDHIIPLKGKNISGLHISSNLRVITKKENNCKYNQWELI